MNTRPPSQQNQRDPTEAGPEVTDDLGLVFDLAPVGLCISRDRILQRCNAAFGAMFGYAPGELHGLSLEMLYPSPHEFENIGAQGFSVMKKDGVYSDERIMRHRNGQLFWCHVAGRSLQRDQPFACAVWMFEDISARRTVSRDLTPREREIARQLAAGQSTKHIARTLGVSPRTIDGHRARILRKLGAKSASEMIAKVVGLG
ncbi:PAS and helix-turn-helix domain-containing protein [Rhodoferax sp. AJA081-3]|uniref:PAS and helix-turn-helix domain-containing protein n=1 Tax=Rhodoferax sp. AJA081-3 TaxID=2752316 RepID=UPI001AE06D3D|nr:PAS and helix-turn-helix domain-containing protein [Rhodoferax sp. AJA081-3]QTN29928.1 PAS and helix-turn-helix domain-containing protein [Rhodoferax sp. AJA081-3]